jgi:hypothetical protein
MEAKDCFIRKEVKIVCLYSFLQLPIKMIMMERDTVCFVLIKYFNSIIALTKLTPFTASEMLCNERKIEETIKVQ